ncbi:MAG TPA: class II fumarate hydratase [Leptolyngbyaceae cyanobacterium M65_K2018_010]|nr:class II fumarate hydratase [Leptolyngbyaceae cyanobacterium M65_K2018_010]
MTDSPPATRLETDSMGAIPVPCDRYWGAQTQRSIRYFSIGQDKMPLAVVHAIALIKQAAARANADLGKLAPAEADLIVQAAEEVMAGQWDDHFPLHVWMTGSGTQCNMNVNEVITNRAIALAGGQLGSKTPIHPNDHVNMSQSSNDVFPAAMHIAAAQAFHHQLLPQVKGLRDSLAEKAAAWADIVKIGRTHMQDAVPLTLGQEFSGYVGMLEDNLARLEAVLPELYPLALGGTAVGTGLNAGPRFGEIAAQYIADLTGLPFITAANKFTVMGAHDALVMASGVLKTLAVSLYKIANDIRLLSCGPRAGFAELQLPANEPGSSIMPGKVNPTQCEALAMVAVQVMGYDAAVAFAGASGYLEMNVYKPLIIFNVLQSARLLGDGSRNFNEFLVRDMVPNRKKIDQYVQNSLMLVTALSPVIGYDQASQIAHHAFEHDLTLKQAALDLGLISAEAFDQAIDPYRMTQP